MAESFNSRPRRLGRTVLTAAAIGLAALLGGCVVAPAPGYDYGYGYGYGPYYGYPAGGVVVGGWGGGWHHHHRWHD